jgi:hypothetical protein
MSIDELRVYQTDRQSRLPQTSSMLIGSRIRRASGSAHRISYLVSPLDGGVLIRISIDGADQASEFLARDTAGKLEAGGPYTVREASL